MRKLILILMLFGIIPAAAQKLNIETESGTDQYDLNTILKFKEISIEPEITSINPESGAVGDEVIIAGKNFGDQRGNSYVDFNGTQAEEYPGWSDTEIVTKVPEGVATGKVKAIINGRESNGVNFVVVQSKTDPVITSVSPEHAAIGEEIILYGKNFGDSRNGSKVKINELEVTEILSWTDTEIHLIVPEDATTGVIIVTVNGVASNEADFIVEAKLASIFPAKGGVGDTVTISGQGFGASQSETSGTVTYNLVPAGIASWSNSQIKSLVPRGVPPGQANIAVTVYGIKSNEIPFTIQPKIDSIVPIAAAVGDEIEIYGTNFTEDSRWVSFNGKQTTEFIEWTDTLITLAVPEKAETGPVKLMANGIESKEADFTVKPGITSTDKDSVAVGDELTITGTNFGFKKQTVKFNNKEAQNISRWVDQEIKAEVPPKTKTGKVTVIVNGLESNGKKFIMVPNITSTEPETAPIGDDLTIKGTTFGDQEGAVYFGDIKARRINSWSDTEIDVEVPSGCETGDIKVWITENIWSKGYHFKVSPKITSVNPPKAPETVEIKIEGRSFHDEQDGGKISFNGRVTTDVVSWSDTLIVVEVPSGANSGDLTVTVDGIESNAYDFEVYDFDVVKIGEQVWMKKNINKGVMLNQGEDPTPDDVVEKFCVDDDPSNCNKYGALYSWEEAMDYFLMEGSQGICPEGWHVPTDEDWKELEMALGMSESEANQLNFRGDGIGTKMKAGGSSGLDLTLAGYAYGDDYSGLVDTVGYYWSSSTYSGPAKYARQIRYDKTQVARIYRSYEKNYYICLRCIMNKED